MDQNNCFSIEKPQKHKPIPTARTSSLVKISCQKLLIQKFLWIISNIMKLLSGCQVLANFQLRSHRNIYWPLLPEMPLWQRNHAKNYSPFLQKLLWIMCNIMNRPSLMFWHNFENFRWLILQHNSGNYRTLTMLELYNIQRHKSSTYQILKSVANSDIRDESV